MMHYNFSSTRLTGSMLLLLILSFGMWVPGLYGQVGSDFVLRASGADVDYAAANPTSYGMSTVISLHQISGVIEQVQGYSLGLGNDSTLLMPIIATNLLVPPGGHGVDFDQIAILPEGVTEGVVLSFPGLYTISFETETDLLGIEYQLMDGPLTGATTTTSTSLDFVDTLGSPPVDISIVIEGASYPPSLASGAVTLTPHDGAPLIRGDASQDGTLDLADGVGILQYLFIGAAADCLDALDANDSGNVSITDAIRVLCALYCSGSPPPESPFPGCGFDSTADSLGCLSYPGCP
ncbi:MAG TPA: hypothetical protein EYQ08_08440 [Planctomycetes bacterium]|nr:hypothetical protein [Planctomycetota bacterium]